MSGFCAAASYHFLECSCWHKNGAVKIGNQWAIPDNESKPVDARIKSGKYIKKTDENGVRSDNRQHQYHSIAAACFSIYAYQELKKQLEGIDELRFIFTSPTFVTEKTPKAQREFYIPRISRERSLYGTEFEVKLHNELTQKAIAKECADWIRKKVTFKSNVTGEQMMGFMTVDQSTYMPINGFTTVECENGRQSFDGLCLF